MDCRIMIHMNCFIIIYFDMGVTSTRLFFIYFLVIRDINAGITNDARAVKTPLPT